MKKWAMKAALVQINNSFAGQNYIPYSAGIIQSYFESNSPAADCIDFSDIIYKRCTVNQALINIEGAKILGLSLYVWNARLSLEIAKAFREKNQDAVIFVGGPSVPDESESFLRANSFIDVALHNEGEISVAELLEQCVQGRDWSKVHSASFIQNNEFKKTEQALRIKDLSIIPSPFLEGTFDKLFRDNKDEKWIGLWETNRGCPFTCTYCDWGSAVGSKQIGMFDQSRLESEIEWFSKNRVEYIFCCDANFGMFPRDPVLARMVGLAKEKTGFPQALSVQNTKNSTERSYLTQKILCDYGLNKGVTLSMQTLSPEALKNIKRSNIRLSSYFELQKRFIDEKVPTYSDLILALPGETRESYEKGLCKLIESGQHTRIQFNNLSILPNAEMAKESYRDEHGLVTVISDVVNMHGSLLGVDDIAEKQELVVGTTTLSTSNWEYIRAYSWFVGFSYFNKILQIPVSFVNGTLGVDLHIVFKSLFIEDDRYPVIKSIIQLMKREAHQMTVGGPEFKYSREWLNIFWPLDEYLFIETVVNSRFDALYNEVSQILEDLLRSDHSELVVHYGEENIFNMVREACDFNKWLLNIPGQDLSHHFKSEWSIADCYVARMRGSFAEVKKEKSEFEIVVSRTFNTFEEWLQNVVWYGNKRGDYLNSFKVVDFG